MYTNFNRFCWLLDGTRFDISFRFSYAFKYSSSLPTCVSQITLQNKRKEKTVKSVLHKALVLFAFSFTISKRTNRLNWLQFDRVLLKMLPHISATYYRPTESMIDIHSCWHSPCFAFLCGFPIAQRIPFPSATFAPPFETKTRNNFT